MINIDKIKLDDLNDLINLYAELECKTDLIKIKKSFEWMECNPDYILIGAKSEENELIGSLLGIICNNLIGESRPFMIIENVIIKSNFRGNGAGKFLLQYIENIARERNCYHIMFVSACERKEAHKFYNSLGYSSDVVQGFKKYLDN